MWITNGNVADIAIVWAQTDDGIQGFIVAQGHARASPPRKSTRR